MKTTKITVTGKKAESIKADLLVYCLVQEKKNKVPESNVVIKKMVKTAFDLGDFKTGEKDERLFYPTTRDIKKGCNARRILILGLGNLVKGKESSVISETLREAGGKIAQACEKLKAKTLTVVLPGIDYVNPERLSRSLTEGILLGDYRFLKYKKNDKKDKPFKGIQQIRLSAAAGLNTVRRGARKARAAAMAVYDARDMANEPGNSWTSAEFSAYARQLSKTHGLSYTCLEKEDMEKLGMGGILAVNQGSDIPPRLIILEYKPKKKSQTILLVGKGITFDSGGISLKPAPGMEEMKYDMCGGAAVLATMKAVGEEKPDVGVVAIVPATDNMSGSKAVRPGDIIRHYNQVTSEIVNTDAEGRMILGDALAYGIETYKPDCVIDAATLTGAVIIGLGHHHSGLMGNNNNLAERVIESGRQAGEPVWQLPLTKAYKKQIKSKVADIKNIGGKAGGTITAAAYLSNFVGKTPWVHLDIAGTAWNFTEKSYVPKGPSGIGVRTFLHFIQNWKAGCLG